MILRRKLPAIKEAITRQAAVALIGPRQVGKTTLALKLSEEVPSLYLDLEASEDRRKLADPVLFLRQVRNPACRARRNPPRAGTLQLAARPH